MTRPNRNAKGGKTPGQKVRKRWSDTTSPRAELALQKTILGRLRRTK